MCPHPVGLGHDKTYFHLKTLLLFLDATFAGLRFIVKFVFVLKLIRLVLVILFVSFQ